MRMSNAVFQRAYFACYFLNSYMKHNCLEHRGAYMLRDIRAAQKFAIGST